MKKNKKELFDKETLEMFESINKASVEEVKEKKVSFLPIYLLITFFMGLTALMMMLQNM